MKLFVVENGKATSDFEVKDDFEVVEPSYSSNAHSGGAVVLAETEEEARALITKHVENWVGTLTEISLDKSGVILYADGDC